MAPSARMWRVRSSGAAVQRLGDRGGNTSRSCLERVCRCLTHHVGHTGRAREVAGAEDATDAEDDLAATSSHSDGRGGHEVRRR